MEKYKAEQEQNAPDHSQGPATVTFRAPPTPQPAPVENFERAREAVAEWPAWKREHTLTKHSEGVALQAPAKGVGSTDTLQTTATMSSREIAELTGKEHFNVLIDIRKMLAELKIGDLSFQGSYLSAQNKAMPEFRLPKDLTITLVSGYSIPMRHRIVTRWMELEEAVKPVQAPVAAVSKDPLDLLMIQAQMFPQLIAEMQERRTLTGQTPFQRAPQP